MTITGDLRLLFLAVWPFFGAFIAYLIGRKSKRGRDYFANFMVILEFALAILLAFSASNEAPLMFEWSGFMGFRIYLLYDGFRCIYAIITALMWMMTTLFSREYFAHYRNRNRYYIFMLMTLGGTMGVFLSGDLITTFMFFEMMSFTSYVMVIHDEKPAAQRAADTYMAVAVIGGLAMLMGIFIVKSQLHTTEISAFYDAMHHFEGDKGMLYLAAAFMLIGFGGKAGMYPLHVWLPNAHPVAPAPASALLSGVLTKTGVFGIIVVSTLIFAHEFEWGFVILIIGTLGMFTGALLALFSVDLKRTLACSSMSQIGFILVGIGMQGILGHHNALAVRGTLMHMVNHSLIKLVLFMMAGVVYMNLHKLNLNDVRGFGRKKPLLTFCFAMGVLAIIGMPFWSGYVSKTMLHESIVEQIWLYADYEPWARFFQVIESIFTLTGGLTTAYMIKIFTCVCIEKNQFNQNQMTALNGRYMNKTSSAVLFLSAIVLPILGFSPNTFMIPISKFGQVFMMGEDPAHAVEFFAWINVKGAVASLSIGAIVYILIVRGCLMAKDAQGRSIYINAWPPKIDIETYIYRPLLMRVLPFIGAFVTRIIGAIPGAIASFGYKIFMRVRTFWVENSGKGAAAEALADARAFVAQPRGFSVEQLRLSYAAFADRAAAADEVIWEGETDFAGGGQILRETVRQEILAEAEEAKRHLHDDHGHDDHHDDHGDDHGEHHEEKNIRQHIRGFYMTSKGLYVNRGKVEEGTEKLVEMDPEILEMEDAQGEKIVASPAGAYDWMVYFATRLYQRMRQVFRPREITDALAPGRRMPAFLQNDMMRTVFNSLAYSLLLFLVGFVVILLVILNR